MSRSSDRVPGSEWSNELTLIFFTPVVYIAGGIAFGLAMGVRALMAHDAV